MDTRTGDSTREGFRLAIALVRNQYENAAKIADIMGSTRPAASALARIKAEQCHDILELLRVEAKALEILTVPQEADDE